MTLSRIFEWRLMVEIRPYRPEDLAAVSRVFYDAVHIGAARAYSDKERWAWAPHLPLAERWGPRLLRQAVLVAWRDRPVGFFAFRLEDGYIDLAYVDPKVQGQGAAYAIYSQVEDQVRRAGAQGMTTEASLVARPFFERQGWVVTKAQIVEQRGAELRNFKMLKDLSIG